MNGIKTNEKIIIGRTDLAKDEYEKYQGKQLPDFGNEEFEIKNISVTKNNDCLGSHGPNRRNEYNRCNSYRNGENRQPSTGFFSH